MKKILTFSLIVITAATAIYAAIRQISSPQATPPDALRVTASFYPMAEFTRQVGQEHVSVTTLVQPGVEPHDYDPTPQDIIAVHQSKVLVYNGAGLEPWADKLKNDLQSHGTLVVAASDGLAIRNGDPHVWLDPVMAAAQVEKIKAALSTADPAHRADYDRNAAAYEWRLHALDTAFRTGLASCTQHVVITSHQALNYLAAQYGFQAIGIAGISPDEEPSPQKLAEISGYVRQQGIRYIFFETLTSPKLSDTIARETGAKTLVFNPLESLSSAEISGGQDYISVQQSNLENLKLALNCK